MEENHKTLFTILCVSLIFFSQSFSQVSGYDRKTLRFNANGRFKILQFSDAHYLNGIDKQCFNVYISERPYCSDLNTTSFLQRTIASEKPDLIVFSGDNVFGFCNTNDAAEMMKKVFGPAIESGIPWAAILGNHDEESDMSRETMMRYIMTLPNSLSQVNPIDGWKYNIEGFGNYNLQIEGPFGSPLFFKSLLNLFMVDGGAYTHQIDFNYVYDWVKTSQMNWYEQTSKSLEVEYKKWPFPQNSSAPGLVFVHIPLPEFALFNSSSDSKMVGVRQEKTCCSKMNSGFFTKILERGDVKGVFSGHDHVNDFCGELHGVNLCYAGGAGYSGYGLEGWARRCRVIEAQLGRNEKDGRWGGVDSITSWKRLDDKNHSLIDTQLLWAKNMTLQANSGPYHCVRFKQH